MIKKYLLPIIFVIVQCVMVAFTYMAYGHVPALAMFAFFAWAWIISIVMLIRR